MKRALAKRLRSAANRLDPIPMTATANAGTFRITLTVGNWDSVQALAVREGCTR